ncbi:probable LRR receptor-like serine/threonine-protein kinase At1g06840 [Vigna unguiculata]|uniref:non-specific serine/threonine protein kinase n=1 Tax=Vigna unguiculata TaxID=3917 RepID=A0A4D6NEL2_VIGUN|nr:probable LRR receptor-like serine/threonine-protein kinase At1g06840 [Vigna unguiculata]XP_027928949.1 probable LRR receptor-like serine/threonine-protein kinase At1g06840 [Vigna unguiculata]XP_027928951.1 probable LRR receptor-like serine/threonine-protein kinase At1g06840 [Vigna unguiculata]XP_027928952.1 probable LRR receptor-like serine/threonine-protein kinase At1g06840 [Vigna unguiculata]XP_027928953.1 probable LRR receptor-like serine/threonine-protein kinase At1g06840 [Vigna unguicul
MPALRIHGYALALSFCLITFIAASQRTDPSEVNALIDIKKSLIDRKHNLKNWNKGDPCTRNWTGVWCFDKTGDDGYLHVREIYLMTMNLSGNLSPQLGQLSHLEIMDFMWNNLTGTIPKEIGNIKTLKLLLLNGNMLSGSLPDELGNLPNLNRFQVDENQLSGSLPDSLANMTSVKHLHLNNNSFSGQLPSTLSKLSNLMHLLVDNNNLSGNLPPEYSMLKGLAILQLDNNNFSGNGIPSTYANLTRLVKLSLRNCSLQGAIPDFSSIPKLTYLDLSWNQFTGPLSSNKLADNMTTIDLSNNLFNGSIPRNYSYPHLQKLSLANNLMSGSIPASIWQNMSFGVKDKLIIDLHNNSFEDVLGNLNPPANVTLRLSGNPICKNSNTQSVGQYCGPEEDKAAQDSTNSTVCPVQSCPFNDFYEYAPNSPVPCYCAAPLRIGYRLKSPSFSYFAPYRSSFEHYITDSLKLHLYQLSVDSVAWEEGPRLRMYLKLFPSYNDSRSNVFNESEVRRISSLFTSWRFPRTDFFGPYELLNFTLLGPYENIIIHSEKGKVSVGIKVAVAIAAAACALAISAIIILLITRRRMKYHKKISRKSTTNLSIKIDGMKSFTYKELALATNKFNISTKVGQGGYGNVYKGILSDESFVAVKRAEAGSLQGQREFLTEIELLSRLHHRNLVSLIGYCNEEGEQMLVYEFMPNGTLRDWISGRSRKTKGSLNFSTRLRIAMGAAKGILYLHTEANPPIFHRDIKASNILLDSKFTAKVADFGLSRLVPDLDEEGTAPKYVSTVVRGTPGYLDPEYLLTHKLTDKCDVYSLGIVYLELLTGMQPISHGKNIVREVNMARQSGTVYSIIDSRIGLYTSECLEKFLTLALSCCQDHPEERPSMIDVVRTLEDIIAMLPEAETVFSDVSLDSSGNIAPPSSSASASTSASHVTREEQHMSSYVSGSDLVSDVIPTIVPR